MRGFLVHTIQNENFLVLPQKCLYWENQKTLLLSDLHLGKSGHFRKNGIGIPQNIFKEDMQQLLSLIQYFKPKYVLIIGDFFHSHANKEHDFFLRWKKGIAYVNFQLVLGNHDVLNEQWYRDAGISLYEEKLILNQFCFMHDADISALPGNSYTFCGHIHPAVKLSGAGKQSLTLPCFYFSKYHAVLPAFGNFTGTHIVSPKKYDSVYIIAENKVMKIM